MIEIKVYKIIKGIIELYEKHEMTHKIKQLILQGLLDVQENSMIKSNSLSKVKSLKRNLSMISTFSMN